MNGNEKKTNDNEGRDEDAVRRLVAENLNLVRKEAWRMARARACGETAAEQAALAGELAQAGVLGLRRAAEKFDPGLGYALSTYAMPWIRKTEGAAADEWSRMRTGLSLDAPAGEDGEATLGDFVPDGEAEDPSEAADRALSRDYARALLDGRPERDRAMVEMHFGLRGGDPAPFAEIGAALWRWREEHACSQAELGELLGISRAAVSRWETGVAPIDFDRIRAKCPSVMEAFT